MSCESSDISVQPPFTEKEVDNITVTVKGRVPVYLYIFSAAELTLTGQSVMRRSAEICATPCGDDLKGVYIVTTGFFKGQLRGSYEGDSTEITIPLTVRDPDTEEEITVTSIWQDVFSRKGLTEVAFAEGIELTRIHARAFQTNSITSITFPESLKRIDLRSFRNNQLTEVTIPSEVHTIELEAFAGNNITEVTIGANVTTIGDNIFGDNTHNFKAAYEHETTGGAGTYKLDDTTWAK